ncbi:MAG: baseplate J/gp47 family protein [Caulobacter sp.]|nr:baseplate J/gp47 family protein [Caulobacter sp.]
MTSPVASSNAVDLSRLPAPTVVEPLDFETILAAMRADLVARKPDLADALAIESEPLNKLLEVCAYRELILRQRVNDAAKAVMVAYAEGTDLDQLAALMGVSRLEIAPADPESGAAAVMEEDEDLRKRVVLAPEGFTVAGPEGAYIFHALSADADVLDASVSSPTPGQVVVTVLSRQGNGVADEGLLAAVAAAVSADSVRPLTDQVLVQSAAIVDYAVVAQIFTFEGPDSALVLAQAQAQLAAYVEAQRKLGRDITRSGLYAALHVGGVQRVALTQPAADVAISATQAAHLTSSTVTHGGVAD